ncbi:hypothetical protein [Streptomyces niveus]|uniref:hypothetical protein n=1 Tax=Streptomyces niveus TaxID=193462 RepID=UPI0003C5B4CE|nr:hypothetical protein [Streptomyces niveus]EST22755.1 hypothetical protein M877_28790 [Streptomyces niveus NCIMB 11891]
MGEALQAALADRYDALSGSLRDRLIGFVLDAFDSLGDYRDADAALFIERVLPVVLATQQQMGQLTDAYLTSMIADMLGGAAAPAGVQLAEALRGTPPEEVYRRPFVTAYTALSRGADYVDAIGQARTRLLSITETDLQLARTHAARQSMQRGGARFFRRRLNKTSGTCALCVIASTQRYRVAELMPIHPGCHCKPEPLPGNRDPGQIIDERLLEDAHDAIAKGVGSSDRGGRTPDYRDVIITREHGEIGPLLAVRRDHFTGPDDIPAA